MLFQVYPLKKKCTMTKERSIIIRGEKEKIREKTEAPGWFFLKKRKTSHQSFTSRRSHLVAEGKEHKEIAQRKEQKRDEQDR